MAVTLTTIRDRAMKRAAGTPLPDTSAIINPVRVLSMGITSSGTTSKKSPPTSFAGILFAAISNPWVVGIVSGRKFLWISAAIWSSAFFRAISDSSFSFSSLVLRSSRRLWIIFEKIKTATALMVIIGRATNVTIFTTCDSGVTITICMMDKRISIRIV